MKIGPLGMGPLNAPKIGNSVPCPVRTENEKNLKKTATECLYGSGESPRVLLVYGEFSEEGDRGRLLEYGHNKELIAPGRLYHNPGVVTQAPYFI